MDSHRFDLLTKQLARGASRRQVLKGIFSFAVGGMLGSFGFKEASNVYAAVDPNQTFDDPLYMPHLAKTCTKASTGRDRTGTECGAFPNCYCIGTPEGDIKCGKLPSTCHVPLCTSSADCAHLGEGYFCDVPFSGNCTDPPANLSRCIAPCDNSCDEAKICGTKCCTDSQTCSDGACVSSYDCELEAVTISTMRAALDALAAGESVVNLSPQGCMKVRQNVVDGKVVSKSFEVANRAILHWRQEENRWIGESDADRDGFYEWLSVTTYGPAEGEFQTVETDFSPETHAAWRRKAITPQGGEIHVVIEETDEAGVFQVVKDFLTPAVQGVVLGKQPNAEAEEATSPMQSGTCEGNPCDPAKIKERMELAVDRASNCLTNFGDRGIEFYMKTYDLLQRNMSFRCEPLEGNIEAAIGNWADPQANLVVFVDPERYCKLTDEQREWVLYHEVLHAATQTGHESDVERLPEEHRKQLDRIYGCIALCYNNQADPTKCMCAQCFATVTCDPICAAFKSDCGATCPCPGAENFYYNTCFDCLAGCPSGLTCFGYNYCDPVGHSPICTPKPTCP